MTCNMTCLINNWTPGTEEHAVHFQYAPRAVLLVGSSYADGGKYTRRVHTSQNAAVS
jgi:hypothetical protein